MDQRRHGVMAETLWDLRARCEAQLRVLAELQQALDEEARDGAGSLAGHPRLQAGLDRVRRLALQVGAEAERCRAKLLPP